MPARATASEARMNRGFMSEFLAGGCAATVCSCERPARGPLVRRYYDEPASRAKHEVVLFRRRQPLPSVSLHIAGRRVYQWFAKPPPNSFVSLQVLQQLALLLQPQTVERLRRLPLRPFHHHQRLDQL